MTIASMPSGGSWRPTTSATRYTLNSFEPKDINFAKLCQDRYPGTGKAWKDLSLQEQTSLIASALRAEHFLLDPHSRQMRHWDVVVLVALAFTGLITPYEAVFIKEIDTPLFITNRVFDLVFVIDMVLQLFLKIEVKQEGKYGTIVVRDPKVLRQRYCRNWFLLDLISIVPFDIALLFVDGQSQHQSLQKMKIFRCLRLCRLVKLLRILRTSRIVLRWQNYLAVPFSHQKFCKFTGLLLMASHWMACLWGGVGLFIGKDLCPDPAAGPIDPGEPVPLDEVSWVTALYTENKRSPDNPCNNFHTYLAALHWSVMTITSIGYGDIVPMRDAEYIVCIGCMMLGGVLWAYVIGSTCSILSNMHPVEENFELNTDLLNMVMKDVSMPSSRKQAYREFLREAKAHDAMTMFNEVTRSFSPQLRQELMLHINEHWIRRVYYFKDAPRSLVMELAERLLSRFFSKREPLSDIRNCLCLIERGTIAHGGMILVPGNFFQEDIIVTNPALQVVRPTVSLTYTLLLLLSRRDLDDVLRSWPQEERQVRRYAAKLAVCRVVRLCAEYETFQTKTGRGRSSLSDTFSHLLSDASEKPDKALSDKTPENRSGLFASLCQLDHHSSRFCESSRRSQERAALKILNSVAGAHQKIPEVPLTKRARRSFVRGGQDPHRLSPRPVFNHQDAGHTGPEIPQPVHEAEPKCTTGKDKLHFSGPQDSSDDTNVRIENRLDVLAKELQKLSMEFRSSSSWAL